MSKKMSPRKLTASRSAFKRAKRSIPGGVNSPVRAYGSVGGTPPFIESAKGCRIRDIDGNEYLDYVGSWGPMIHGHSHPKVLAAVREAMKHGTSFGAPTERESVLAESIRRVLPSVQKLRMVSSGTEATMSALRLARGVTGRNRILKFDGCYHGHSDGLLVGAGSGVATLGIPGSPGVPKVKPDLTTLGKVVGGGLPAAAYGGRRDLMDRIAPEGDIYQAGTLSGNPLAVAAGTVTLELLEADGVYEKLAKTSETLATGLSKIAEDVGVPLSTRHVGGMFGFFFHEGPVNDFAQAQQSDAAAFKCFFGAMLDEGVYLAPSSYEAGFVSLAHGPRDLAETLEAARKALTRVAQMR